MDTGMNNHVVYLKKAKIKNDGIDRTAVSMAKYIGM